MSVRILVVDDEPDMRLLLKLALGGAGYEVEEAATGEEAIELAAGGGFDLALLDLNLPGISGMDVLDTWNRDGTLAGLPVVMLTADARPGVQDRSAALGARGFLTKPVRPAELIAEIRRVQRNDPVPPATVEGT